jgi:cation diffusion facilitator CzcD-associated flavoprotein CzcO
MNFFKIVQSSSEDGRWRVTVADGRSPDVQHFDGLMLCTGHHGMANVARLPGLFFIYFYK